MGLIYKGSEHGALTRQPLLLPLLSVPWDAEEPENRRGGPSWVPLSVRSEDFPRVPAAALRHAIPTWGGCVGSGKQLL